MSSVALCVRLSEHTLFPAALLPSHFSAGTGKWFDFMAVRTVAAVAVENRVPCTRKAISIVEGEYGVGYCTRRINPRRDRAKGGRKEGGNC